MTLIVSNTIYKFMMEWYARSIRMHEMMKGIKHTKEEAVEDIVGASGVSRSTVFRYLAGKSIRPASREAIAAALRTLSIPETQPLSAAIDIVVSVSPIFNRFRGYAEVLEGVLHRSGEVGARVRMNWDPRSDRTGCGTIILGKNHAEEDEESAILKAQRRPFVLINRVIDDPALSWASADTRNAARELADHLLEQGCSRIALWVETTGRVGRDKYSGYCDALQAAKLPVDPKLVFNMEKIGLEEAFNTARTLEAPPDAWLCMDDESAILVMRMALKAGLRIPEDLAVAGMNDIESAGHVTPSLTSIHIPFREMGMAAVDILISLMDKPLFRSHKILLEHRLVIRDSTQRKRQDDR